MKIEFILKESTLDDVLGPWSRSGHEYDKSNGGFTFESVVNYTVDGGLIFIEMAADTRYIYNISDFYRIKVTYGN